MGKKLRNIAMALGMIPAALGINCHDANVKLVKPDVVQVDDAGNRTPVLETEACSEVCVTERFIYSEDLGGEVQEFDCEYFDIERQGKIPLVDVYGVGSGVVELNMTSVYTDVAGDATGVSLEVQTISGDATNLPAQHNIAVGESIDLAALVNAGGQTFQVPSGQYSVKLTGITTGEMYTKELEHDSSELVKIEYDLIKDCSKYAVTKDE